MSKPKLCHWCGGEISRFGSDWVTTTSAGTRMKFCWASPDKVKRHVPAQNN